MKVGVLGLQGDVAENVSFAERALRDAGRPGSVIAVRSAGDLAKVDALIIPGGESTTIGRMSAGMLDGMKERIGAGMPVLGICAGMVLLSRSTQDRVVGETGQDLLGILDVVTERNSFGRQQNSFERTVRMEPAGIPEFPGVFIRAPSITGTGPGVRVLAELDGRAVAVSEGKILATSFHPELTDDTSVHRYFIGTI